MASESDDLPKEDIRLRAVPSRPQVDSSRVSLTWGDRVFPIAERYALFVLTLAIIVFFAVLPSTGAVFVSSLNIQGLLANQAVMTILTLGMLFPLIVGEFDISVGAILGATSYLTAHLMVNEHYSWALAVAIAVVVGTAIGAINGYLIAYVGASSLIITLGMSTLLAGLMLGVAGGTVVSLGPSILVTVGSAKWLGLPEIVWGTVVFVLIIGYVLRYTTFGRRILLIGSNTEAARLVGLRVKRLKMRSFMVSGLISSIAGTVLLMRSGSADPNSGPNFLLASLAIAFLGATTFTPGRFNVPGTIVAVFFIAVAVNGLTLAGAAIWVQPVFDGVSLMAAVSLAVLFRRRHS